MIAGLASLASFARLQLDSFLRGIGLRPLGPLGSGGLLIIFFDLGSPCRLQTLEEELCEVKEWLVGFSRRRRELKHE